MRAAPGNEPSPGPVAQRRVTSVLFGDLVGFTVLSEGRDQEDVRELLSRYFETSRRIVERYGGVVEKFIGDAVMAVWGVPTANEDDAERAVRAGLELVAAVAGLREEVGAPGLDMRIGIVTGEVAVTLGAEGQGMVAGDAVNTAARIQSVAEPGQVWVDATTRLLTQRAIEFVDQGERELKGKAEPVRLFAVRAVVAGAGGSQRTDGLEAPLVGRDRELRMIKEAFDRTGEQGSPSLVVLSGEGGVGKTRLAWEFEKYVDGLPAVTMWHTGRCVAYGERVPYYALAEALRARLRLTAAGAAADPEPTEVADARRHDPDDSATEDMGALLDTSLRTLVPDEAERDWIAPRLGALLGVGSLGEFARPDLFAAWAAFLRRVGTDAQSVVLRIDDAEHADEGLIGFVEHLMASRFPVFVMLIGRRGLLEDHPELAGNPQSVLVNLPPLADADVRLLLDGLVAGLPESVRSELADRSEGVPLYAVETVRSLVDKGLVVALDGRYVLADREVDLGAIGAPASLQALVAARLDALPDRERSVVDVASVLGQTFHRDHLAVMVGSEVDLDAALEALERGQLVVRETSRWSADFGQYRFVQAVVPQVAYAMIARRERRATHLCAVDIFEAAADPTGELAPVIAEHLSRAVDSLPGESDVPQLKARAREHLVRAADRAEALGSIHTCVAYLSNARELAEDPLVAARLDLRRGLALSGAYSTTAAAPILEPLVAIFDEAGDEVAAAVAAGALATCLVELGRSEEALALAEPRWLALKDRRDADDAVVELAGAMFAYHDGGDVRDYVEAIMRVGLRRGDERMIRRGLSGLAYYYGSNGMAGLARLLYEEVLRRDATGPLSRTVDLSNLAASWMADDVSRAVDHGRQAMHLIDELQLVDSPDVVPINYANALFLAGDWDLAADVVVPGEGLDRPISGAARSFVPTAVAVARGEMPPEPTWTAEDQDEAPVWLRAYGATELAMRHPAPPPERAVADAVRAFRDYYDQVGLSDDHVVIWSELLDLVRAIGDDAAAGELVELTEDVEVDRSVSVSLRGHRHRALGLSARDRADDQSAIDHLRTAVAFYDAWHAAPLAARTRGELGATLLRSTAPKDREEGSRLVEVARQALLELRATVWLDALESMLDSVGADRG